MKKLFYTIFFLLFISSTAVASTTWTINGYNYAVDTLYHAYIGPGTTQTSLKLEGSVNFRIFYTTTDLTCPDVNVRAIKHTDRLKGTGTISSAINSHSDASRNYFAGANADFFSYTTSAPCGINVVDGEMYCSTSSSGWTIFGINASGLPSIGSGSVAITVTDPTGKQINGENVNRPRKDGQIAIYTPRFDNATDDQSSGAEVVIVPTDIESPLTPGATVQMRVQGTPTKDSGNTPIPSGAYVLSGSGAAATFIERLADGDIIKVKCAVRINGITGGRMQQVLGGCPQILSGGDILETENALDHLSSAQPRTAVGFNADRTKLVILVADGRSEISAGPRSKVLAGMMKYVGCDEAMNFDGGGSSELYVKGRGVVNIPSDGAERAVTNGIYLSTNSPQDNEIAQIRFMDWAKTMVLGETYNPVFYGYNRYGVLIDTDVKGVVLDTPNTSTFSPVNTGTFTLSASYGECSAQIIVTVTGGASVNSIPIDNAATTVFPIPAKSGENIKISSKGDIINSIKLLSINGVAVSTAKASITGSKASITTDGLTPGSYILLIKTNVGLKSSTIIIK